MNKVQHLSVLDAFKPLPASLKDENDWPCFVLADAEVRSEATNELANLLLASEANPMTVTGRVNQVDAEEKSYVIDRDSIPANLKIRSIHRFSFGQYEDGIVAFWVPSEAGWFEVVPNRRYKDHLKNMTETIKILYFCADLFNEMPTRKQVRKTSPERLFEVYSLDGEYKCEDAREARKRFVRHRHALLPLMRQGKEGISWKPTEIFRFLDSDPVEDPDEPADDATMHTPQRAQADDSSEEETAAHLARKGKSSLRPKSDKGKGRASSKGPSVDNIDLDLDEDISMTDTPGVHSTLRRKSEDPGDEPPTKRRRGRPPKNRPVDESPLSLLNGKVVKPESSPIEAPLPLHARKTAQEQPPAKLPTHRVTIETTPLPSFEPNAPGDVWQCAFDGCSHKVFAASTQASKALIEEHYKMHAHDSQKQLDLVYAEERPYLPVGNLVNRIWEMAAKGGGGSAAKSPEMPPWKKEILAMQKGVQRKY